VRLCRKLLTQSHPSDTSRLPEGPGELIFIASNTRPADFQERDISCKGEILGPMDHESRA
jgi:hypothetical protein